jgi:hypothetical protein
MSADPTDFDGTLTPLEARADLPSLEGLHVERRKLLPEYARLRALHGTSGKWDAKRKALLEALKIRARMTATKAGEKVTEGYVDALAHADEQYEKFIDQSIADATRYVELETEISEIEERIRDREISLLAYNSEIKLAR